MVEISLLVLLVSIFVGLLQYVDGRKAQRLEVVKRALTCPVTGDHITGTLLADTLNDEFERVTRCPVFLDPAKVTCTMMCMDELNEQGVFASCPSRLHVLGCDSIAFQTTIPRER